MGDCSPILRFDHFVVIDLMKAISPMIRFRIAVTSCMLSVRIFLFPLFFFFLLNAFASFHLILYHKCGLLLSDLEVFFFATPTRSRAEPCGDARAPRQSRGAVRIATAPAAAALPKCQQQTRGASANVPRLPSVLFAAGCQRSPGACFPRSCLHSACLRLVLSLLRIRLLSLTKLRLPVPVSP